MLPPSSMPWKNVNGGCFVREDNDEMGHYVGILRRILILCAVIIAVPVILWTITAFVRYQVTLPKALSLPNPFATASTNAPQRATIAEPTLQPTDPQEAKQTERAVPEGSSFAEHPPDGPPSAPSASQTADTSSATAISNSATPARAHDLLPPFAANDVATAGTTGAVQPAAATEETDMLSASASLSRPIPLPRPRPHDAGRLRTADRVPSLAPTRPRPAVGDSGAQQGTTTDFHSATP
jgi:hypothetical protein